MIAKFTLTTRTRLIIAFFLVAMIPMLLLAFANSRTTRQALIEDANQALFAVASQTAASLDTFIATNLESINTEAQLPTFVEFIEETPQGAPGSQQEFEVLKLVNTLSSKNAFIKSYALLNNNGIVIIDSDIDNVGKDWSEREFFAYYQRPHDTSNYVSPVRFYPPEKQASLYFSSAVHAEDGSVIGVLRVQYLAQVLQNLVEDKNNLAGQGSFGVLFDEYHIHLAHGVEPQVNFIPIIKFDSSKEASLRTQNRLPDMPAEDLYPMQLVDLEEHLSNPDTQRFFEAEDVATGELVNQVAISQLETVPWLVAFFQPQEIFLAPVKAQTANTIVLVSIFAVLAIIVAFSMGQLLGRPIIELAGTVSQFTHGNLEARSEIQSADEIGLLARSFNEMAVRVKSLLTGLEEHAHSLEVEIGERKRVENALRMSEERYRAISELTSDYIYSASIDQSNHLALNWSTDAFNRFTGYTSEELADQGGWLTLVHPDDRDRFTTERQRLLKEGDSDVSEYRIITKDGQMRWLRDYRRSFADETGRVVQLLGAAQDITQQKSSDTDLKNAKDSAESANRAKSAFLANMSHELRTPLNAIIGFTQLLSNDNNLTHSQQDHIQIINRSGEHLLTLINDVLEMSKIEAGRTTLQLSSFDVYNLLDEIEDLLGLRAKQKGIDLRFTHHDSNLPQYIQSDESKLRQILINLVSNAIKFTERGNVSMRARYQDKGGHRLLFEVEDSGPGIAQEELKHLFEAFVQTQSGEDMKEGTGLGLSISREFVRLMDGEIEVVTELGKGSIFKFSIEINLSQEKNIPIQEEARRVIALEPGQQTYRILVVDDRDENRRLLVDLLKPLGFEVREAVNGQEAVNLWQTWDPHLIWMDMLMPIMDGYEATSRIRSLPNGAETVIIAITASAFEENRAMSLQAGAYDFVRKPFHNEDIFDKVAKHLDVRFIYQDTDPLLESHSDVPAEGLNPQLLEGLSADWRSDLHRAAAQADSELINRLIRQVESQRPDLAAALRELVHEFRFDILMEATAQVGV